MARNVTRKEMQAYVKRMTQINELARRAMEEWDEANPGADPYERCLAAYVINRKYGEASAALACQMYDEVAAAQGVAVPPAEPAPTATFGETAKAVRGTIRNQHSTVGATVARLVKQAGEDTTLKNAIRDGAEFAWVPNGDTCGFCIMLASNGWQRAPKGATTRAAHIHANCDCTYAVRFDKRSGVEGYDPDHYKLLWDEAKEAAEDYDGGTGWKDALNALRREHYEENRDKINAQKRAAYRKRVEAQEN